MHQLVIPRSFTFPWYVSYLPALETCDVGLLILAFISIMTFRVALEANDISLVADSRMSLGTNFTFRYWSLRGFLATGCLRSIPLWFITKFPLLKVPGSTLRLRFKSGVPRILIPLTRAFLSCFKSSFFIVLFFLILFTWCNAAIFYNNILMIILYLFNISIQFYFYDNIAGTMFFFSFPLSLFIYVV